MKRTYGLEKKKKKSLKSTRSIAPTLYLYIWDILRNAWHMYVSIFASFSPFPFDPRSKISFNRTATTTPVAVAHTLEYACCVTLGDGTV